MANWPKTIFHDLSPPALVSGNSLRLILHSSWHVLVAPNVGGYETFSMAYAVLDAHQWVGVGHSCSAHSAKPRGQGLRIRVSDPPVL